MDNEWKSRLIDLEMRVAALEKKRVSFYNVKSDAYEPFVSSDVRELWNARRDSLENIICELVQKKRNRHRFKDHMWRSTNLIHVIDRVQDMDIFADPEISHRNMIIAIIDTMKHIDFMPQIEAINLRINAHDDLVILKNLKQLILKANRRRPSLEEVILMNSST